VLPPVCGSVPSAEDGGGVMRVLLPVGAVREGFYDDGVMRVGNTGMPSIWKVIRDFGKLNSDRGWFYYGAVMYSNKNAVEVLPLKDINGSLVLMHTTDRTWIEVGTFYLTKMLIQKFSYNGTCPVDCVLMGGTVDAAAYRYYMAYRHGLQQRPLLFYRTHNGVTESPSSKELWFSAAKDNAQVVNSLVNFDRLYLSAPHLLDAYVKIAKGYLSFSAVKDLMERFVYAPQGSPAFEGELNLDRGKVVGYFGRLNDTHKNTDMVFREFDKLYKAGAVSEVLVTSPMASDKDKPTLDLIPYVDLKVLGMEYLKEVERTRATVAAYESIACPVAMLEQMAHGVVPVVPKDRMWSRSFFGHEFPEYPFMYSSKSEIGPMLRLLMDNDEMYKMWAQKLSDRVRQRYEYRTLKRSLYDDMQQRVDVYPKPKYMDFDLEAFRTYRFVAEAEELAERLGDEFTFDRFMKEAQRLPMRGRGGVPVLSNKGVLRLLEAMGYTDTMDSADIRLRRTRA